MFVLWIRKQAQTSNLLQPTAKLLKGRARSRTEDPWLVTSLSLKIHLSRLQTHRKTGAGIHRAGPGPAETCGGGERPEQVERISSKQQTGKHLYKWSLASSHKCLAAFRSLALSF